MTTASARILIVSACDWRFMPLLRDMMTSIAPMLARDNVEMACFDIGLSDIDRTWLAQSGVQIAKPRVHFALNAEDYSPPLLSFLARPFLPEYFPGYDVYMWIDSDVWLQNLDVLTRYINGAVKTGFAITHESDPGYRLQPWLLGWTAKHFLLGYGPLSATYLLSQRHLNAGMFAARAGASQWEAWAQSYQAAIKRSGALVPHDQFSLNHALYRPAARKAPMPAATFLDPSNNWICDRGVPMWHDTKRAFCKPYAPFEIIGALHLAGPAKRQRYTIRRTGGGVFETFLVRGASPGRPGQAALPADAHTEAAAAA